VDEQKKQTVFDPAKVIAIGIASPAATLLTSRFGIAGTLLGLALGAMILTAVADFLKVYLARTSHAAAHAAVTKVPGAIKAPRGFLPARLFRRKGRARPKAAYQGFSSPPGERWRRRSLLVGRSVIAAGISFLLGLGAVTAIEHSVGKSLSCWVWGECPAQYSSAEEGSGSSDQSTRPSILGGGPSAGSGAAAPGVRPADPQQRLAPTSGTPEAPSSQPPSKAAGSEGSGSGAGDQRQEQSDQQQDSYYDHPEEYEQQSSSSPSSTEEAQWGEYRDGGSAGWRDGTTGEYKVPSVP
jgi:hypothetical protein